MCCVDIVRYQVWFIELIIFVYFFIFHFIPSSECGYVVVPLFNRTEGLFMLYRIADLKKIGENVHSLPNLSNESLNLLSSFGILRDNCYFSKVLVKNVIDQSKEQLLSYLSDIFGVSRCDINILKQSFIKKSIVCIIKFASFNHYIHFENIVLPHNLVLLNRVKNQSRVKSSVNYSSLISVKLVSENVTLVSGNQSGFSSNSVCNALGAGVSPIPSVNCPQSPKSHRSDP